MVNIKPTTKTVKRYVISSLVTFAAGVAIVVIPALTEDLTLEAVKNGALVGIVFSGARLGVKMVLEGFMTWYANKK